MKTENQENGLLEEFDWDSGGVSLFEDPVEKETNTSDAKENEPEKKDSEEPKREEEEEVEDTEFFTEEKEEVDDTKEKEEVANETENSFLNSLNTLKEKGFIEYELEEGTELTEELAEEILNDSLDSKVESKVKSLLQELPDEVVALNKFVLNGGSTEEYFEKLGVKASQENGISKDIDLDIEENQIKIITHQLKNEGYDDEYIEDQIEYFKDSGKIKKIADTHFNKWKENYDKTQKNLIEEKEASKKSEKEARRKFKNNISQFISDKKDIKNFPLTPDDKKALPSYMYDKSVKLENGGDISQMQKDLYEALQDEEKSVVIAKLLKNNFDLSDVTKRIKNDATKEVKTSLKKNSEKIPSKSGGSSQKNGSLADYF